MNTLIKTIKNKASFIGLPGVNDETIVTAEAELGLHFSAEYKDFLKEYGAATFEDHEIFGLCQSKRLNVVQNTLEERTRGSFAESDLYVIENTGMDGVVICQNVNGAVFMCAKGMPPKNISSSLAEYLE